MYYNRILGRFILDAIGYYLISAMISIYFINYMKSYFSEEHKMERLRQDLLNKSKLVKSSSQKMSSPSTSKIKKIYKTAIRSLSIRGGSNTFFEQLAFKTANEIKKLTEALLVILQKRNLAFLIARSYLHLFLLLWRIKINCIVDPITGQTIVISMVLGTSTGIAFSWMGFAATTILTNLLGVIFISRSLSQQLIYQYYYQKLRNSILTTESLLQNKRVQERFLKDKELQEQINQIAEKYNNNEPKIQVNWEENRATKEATENLGIFKDRQNGPIKSTDNRLYNRYLERVRNDNKRRLERVKKAFEKVVSTDENSDIIDVNFVVDDQPKNEPGIKIKD